jgi:hypothetical protein
VAGRSHRVAVGHAVAEVAELGLGGAGSVRLDDLGAEHLRAEAGVFFRLLPAQRVVHVDGGNGVAELAERMPEAARVGAAGDEARHLAAGRDQVVLTDEALDPLQQLVHQKMSER